MRSATENSYIFIALPVIFVAKLRPWQPQAVDVIPIYIRLIPVKFDCTRTGCRLTVKEGDYEDVLDDDFWPEDVYAREWRRNRDNDDGDRHPSGDEGN